MPEKRKKRRHGPPRGHPKYGRKFVVQPDHVIEVKPTICHRRLSDVSQEPVVLVNVSQLLSGVER